MLKGVLYDANNDGALIVERNACKQLCFEYNAIPCDKKDKRTKILQKIVKKIGKNGQIEPNFFCDYGYNIEIGDHFYINHNSVFLDAALIKFGNHVFVGPNCGFYTASRPLSAKLRNQGLERHGRLSWAIMCGLAGMYVFWEVLALAIIPLSERARSLLKIFPAIVLRWEILAMLSKKYQWIDNVFQIWRAGDKLLKIQG